MGVQHKMRNHSNNQSYREIYSLFYSGPKTGEFLKFSNPHFAYAYYLNKRINLLTGAVEKANPTLILQWLAALDEVDIKVQTDDARVIHLFYELGFLFQNLTSLLNDDILLAIDIEYLQYRPYQLAEFHFKNSTTMLEVPQFADYEMSYLAGYEYLKTGDCYQFNLTFPFVGKFSQGMSGAELAGLLWRSKNSRGAYAHGSFIPFLQKFFISNSPECLFRAEDHREGVKIITTPIKGSMPLHSGQSLKQAWQELQESAKNQAELYMITDLLRNDLAKIETPTARVIFKKRPLCVPKILHQYSRVEVILKERTFLGPIIRALFPGGSITGAPKKRVTKILHQLEKRNRGFYCGSTILLFKNIRAASINIRSLEYNLDSGEFSYGAGGGVTLLSDVREEYNEMILKTQSFFELLIRE